MQSNDSIKVGNNFKWILGICAVLIVCLVSYGAFKPANEVVPEGYLSPAEIETRISNAVEIEVGKVTETKDAEIADLTNQLADKVIEGVEEVKEKQTFLGYVIDKIFFDDFSEMDVELSDRELNLFDGKVEFDDEDYDAEEVFELDGLEVLVNEKDFNGVPYLVIPEGSVSYKIVFEDELNTSLIDEDETLKFNLLGKEVEISEWDVDTITFTQGEEIYLNDEESVTIGSDVIVLEMVFEDKVKVSVNGEHKSIEPGETAKFMDLEVYVKEIDFSGYAGGYFGAELLIGEDVENTIETKDEYEEDSIWEYVIDANSIGIVLKEEFNELDDELRPLEASETMCLPNDYVCVRFNGLMDEDTYEITFELEDDFVEIRGEFQNGLNDYNKVLVNSSGIFDKDEEKIVGTTTLGDSDVVLERNATDITIEDFTVNLDLDVSNVGDDEDDFRTEFGILVNNPEDSVEDFEWSIVVPENQLESSISVL